ncbi:class II D-tagatose-bisphosphate aldolase non-catalytic subunit [Plantactinospora solaniradicis]|uniref:Class II D-tagatose-bisphosphate aldolase non-catalytic subunit n=1 Tax=Plantactinospora solaniradicis TaxID=1723736 RepID=A0ABW1K995_9ACTN
MSFCSNLSGQQSGSAVGIPLVWSVYPLVIEAAVSRSCDDGAPLLLDATSNQVDQLGGCPGQPSDFRDLVFRHCRTYRHVRAGSILMIYSDERTARPGRQSCATSSKGSLT